MARRSAGTSWSDDASLGRRRAALVKFAVSAPLDLRRDRARHRPTPIAREKSMSARRRPAPGPRRYITNSLSDSEQIPKM